MTTRFHQAFERRPQEEVEVDFQKALDEVRKDKNARRGLPPFSPVYGGRGGKSTPMSVGFANPTGAVLEKINRY